MGDESVVNASQACFSCLLLCRKIYIAVHFKEAVCFLSLNIAQNCHLTAYSPVFVLQFEEFFKLHRSLMPFWYVTSITIQYKSGVSN